MKRMVAIVWLTMTWLANAAALEPVAEPNGFQIMAAFDTLPQEARATIIARGFPGLAQFLIGCSYAHKNCIEIPALKLNCSYIITLSPCEDKLVIIPRSYDDSAPAMIIWDLAANRILHQIPHRFWGFYKALITPDGNTVVTAVRDNRVIIWDLHSGQKIHKLRYCCWFMALNQDGSKLLTVQNCARIWDVKTGEIVATILRHDGARYLKCAISPDGTKVAFGCEEGYEHEPVYVYVFDVSQHREIFSLPYDGTRVKKLQFSCDGTQLIADVVQSVGQTEIFPRYIWSMTTGNQLSKQDHEQCQSHVIENIRIEHNPGDSTKLFDNQTGQLIFSFKTKQPNRSIFKNKWLVTAAADCDKIYAWNFDILHPMNDALLNSLGLLSWRQIVLLLRIQKKFSQGKKLLLDSDNPASIGFIYDYGMLPDLIKDCVKDHVSFGAQQ